MGTRKKKKKKNGEAQRYSWERRRRRRMVNPRDLAGNAEEEEDVRNRGVIANLPYSRRTDDR